MGGKYFGASAATTCRSCTSSLNVGTCVIHELCVLAMILWLTSTATRRYNILYPGIIVLLDGYSLLAVSARVRVMDATGCKH